MRRYNNDVKFFKDYQRNIGLSLHVAQLVKVVTLLDGKRKANLQPLAKNIDGEKRPLLLEVPVGKTLRKDIAAGDVGVVVFLDRSAEEWDGGNSPFELSNSRAHSLNDAVLIQLL